MKVQFLYTRANSCNGLKGWCPLAGCFAPVQSPAASIQAVRSKHFLKPQWLHFANHKSLGKLAWRPVLMWHVPAVSFALPVLFFALRLLLFPAGAFLLSAAADSRAPRAQAGFQKRPTATSALWQWEAHLPGLAHIAPDSSVPSAPAATSCPASAAPHDIAGHVWLGLSSHPLSACTTRCSAGSGCGWFLELWPEGQGRKGV